MEGREVGLAGRWRNKQVGARRGVFAKHGELVTSWKAELPAIHSIQMKG